MKQRMIQLLPAFALASFTLGLAPFFPEPHIWEKIRWIATGQGMNDIWHYIDILVHGTPWVLLFTSLIMKLTDRKKAQS